MPWRVRTVEEARLLFCRRVVLGREKVAVVCREFGISRPTGYKWLARYREAGLSGLSDQCRAPHQTPGRASSTLEGLVLELKHRYPYWGPRKLHRLLYESHPDAERVSISTLGRILARHGLVIPREEPPVYPTVGRFERSVPNELWQMDLKMALRARDGHKRYVAGILDDHSRFALGLWWLPDISDSSVLACWIAAAQQYGLPQQTLTDHGAQFCMSEQSTGAFRIYLWACGVAHRQGRVGHPQTQGKIERFWGTFQRELTPQLRQSEPANWPALMENWRRQYNTLRPHESLGDLPPASRYRKSEQRFTEPDRNARIGQKGSIYRRVDPRGRISLGGQRLMVGRGLVSWVVEIRPLGNGCWHVYFRNHFLREFMLTIPRKSVNHVPVQL